MTEWKEFVLGEVADFIDYRGKTPKKTSSGVPLITAKIVKNGSIQEPNEYISHEDYLKWMTRGFPKVGDVVLTTEAPLGEVAQIKDPSYALAQRIITLRGKKGIIDNGYLKYFLQSTKGQNRLKERETGTTVTGIKSSELKKILISAPDLSTQSAIAEILSSLDDKIELNNQINQNLEALAQVLFKQWFVDFEFHCLPENYSPARNANAGNPTRNANAGEFSGAVKPNDFVELMTYQKVGGLPVPDGKSWFVYVLLCEGETFYKGITTDLYRRFYEHYKGIGAEWTKTHKPKKVIHWEIFSSKEEAAIREKELKSGFGRTWLQRQWKKVKGGLPAPECQLRMAGEMVDSELGRIPKGWRIETLSEIIDFNPTEKLKKGDILAYLDMASLPTNGSFPSLPILREFTSGMKFKNGDTLLARITPCLENGKTAFIQFLKQDEVGWGSTEFIVLRPKNGWPKEFGYLLARDENFRNFAIQNLVGTSGRQRVASSVLMNYKFGIPKDQEILTAFGDSISSLFDLIKENSFENIYLSELRDTLLPKLISGELEVKEVKEEMYG